MPIPVDGSGRLRLDLMKASVLEQSGMSPQRRRPTGSDSSTTRRPAPEDCGRESLRYNAEDAEARVAQRVAEAAESRQSAARRQRSMLRSSSPERELALERELADMLTVQELTNARQAAQVRELERSLSLEKQRNERMEDELNDVRAREVACRADAAEVQRQAAVRVQQAEQHAEVELAALWTEVAALRSGNVDADAEKNRLSRTVENLREELQAAAVLSESVDKVTAAAARDAEERLDRL
eukprot:gene13645-20993_t